MKAVTGLVLISVGWCAFGGTDESSLRRSFREDSNGTFVVSSEAQVRAVYGEEERYLDLETKLFFQGFDPFACNREFSVFAIVDAKQEPLGKPGMQFLDEIEIDDG